MVGEKAAMGPLRKCSCWVPRGRSGWGASVTFCFVPATKAQIKVKLETFFGQLDDGRRRKIRKQSF